MECAWFEDPIFDHEGDEWRRMQRVKEAGMQIVKVSGTTFRRESVKAAIDKKDVVIVPEPENPHDANALRVEVGGFHASTHSRMYGWHVERDARCDGNEILKVTIKAMPSCLEVCAGMGGISRGVADAGFEHVLLVEKDAKCIETLQANGFANLLHESVERVDFRSYKGAVDLVCGGCPCVSFSVGGKNAGACDPRNLWEDALRCVSECEPKVFLFENSSHMTTPRHEPYLDGLICRFEKLGFTVTKHLVNAMHYGVPQCRKRLLLIGTRSVNNSYDPPPRSTPHPITVREALSSLGSPNGQNGHKAHPAVARSYRGHTPSSLDRPSHAVVSGVHGCPGGANTIQLDNGSIRYYTPRELARLQAFPDQFVLPSVWSTAVRQIGNAAPPLLIRAFAERLLPCLVPSVPSDDGSVIPGSL